MSVVMVTQVGLDAPKDKQFQLCVNSAKSIEQDYTAVQPLCRVHS